MSENGKAADPKTGDEKKKPDEHEAPAGSTTERTLALETGELRYDAIADWVVLRKRDEPVAEIFHVAYLQQDAPAADRPVTFVFNGGPGAASAYLHLGALGPRRVVFEPDGTAPPPPARLTDNLETWLAFTDLVFIDPVGTGFSRVVKKKKDDTKKDDKGSAGAPAKGPDPAEKEFWGLNRDLESLGEFASRFLSRHRRWLSPVFIAGESYGGFRVAKLARKMQEGYGVGLNGAILISPALEWYFLTGSDYDVLGWAGVFPSMVAAAVHHGRSRAFEAGTDLDTVLAAAESFAGDELAPLLAQGESMEEARREKILARMSDLVGLSADDLRLRGGRLDILVFARLLLRDRRRWLGLYDASVSAPDPFPDRDPYAGPDPTLFSIERIFTAGANALLRDELGLATERDYHLLNFEVNTTWKVDVERHAFDSQVGSTDDLRYGMALNPHMQVFLTHGIYDLVTPYWASNRIAAQMKLDESLRPNLHIQHFNGGHMFYTWEDSRKAFTSSMRAFYARATGGA